MNWMGHELGPKHWISRISPLKNPQHVCGEGHEKDVFPSTEPLILVFLTCLIRPKYLAEAFQTKNRQPAKTTFWDS
jgi:hypothetical protein